jgi:hypothetical protein
LLQAAQEQIKLLQLKKKFWKQTRTKGFGKKFLRTDPEICFKNYYIRSFFGTKAAKRKLQI